MHSRGRVEGKPTSFGFVTAEIWIGADIWPTRLALHSSCNKAMQIPRPKNMPWHWLRYRRVDAWVAGLDWLKAECIAKTPMSEHRCHVLPLPLDERWFTT